MYSKNENCTYSNNFPYTFVSSCNRTFVTCEGSSCDACNRCLSFPHKPELHEHFNPNCHRDKVNINDQFLMNQLDGNVSISSESSSFSSDNKIVADGEIPVIIGNRPPQSLSNVNVKHPRVLKTIRRDNKAVQGMSLPVISNYNMRSIFPKIDSFAEDFFERGTGLSFLSEIFLVVWWFNCLFSTIGFRKFKMKLA